MFEHRKKPLASVAVFRQRILQNFLIASCLVFISLLIGMVGYHFIAHLSWLDSLLNASMILTGMGPVNAMPNDASKLFASCYALFSGVAFLTTAAVLLAPIVHRFMHRFHIDDSDN